MYFVVVRRMEEKLYSALLFSGIFFNIFAYRRKNKEEELVVICNFFDQTVPCHMEELGDSWKLLICNYKEIEQSLVLRPYKARMYGEVKVRQNISKTGRGTGWRLKFQ